MKRTTLARSRRLSAGAALVLAAAVTIVGCASPAPTPSEPAPGVSEDAAPALEKDTLTFSYSSAVQQLEKVPLHLALESLGDAGITATESFHQSGEDGVQAVARGESDFGVANAPTVFAAIGKGIPIKAVATAYYPAYVMVATTDVADPCGLTGKRVGIHAQVSATTLYTNMALDGCDDAGADILVVPGSAARVQALIAGQLDASVVQFADVLTLENEAPGKFHVIFDVARENLGIIDSVVFTHVDTVTNSPVYVQTFIDALLATHNAIYGDEAGLAAAIAEVVPETSLEVATELARISIEDLIWPKDGGLSDTEIASTLAALEAAQMIASEDMPTAEDCCTAVFLR